MALLTGQFGEFTGLLSAVREGVRDLQQATAGQQAENQAQAEHRRQVQVVLDQILQLLQDGPVPIGEAGVVYNALPPDSAAFTGRGGEIGEIIGQVAAAAVAGTVIGISAIDGMPGVGKSALAVHVAHRLADRFPDRQLFVDLHAHTAGRTPADPIATLAGLLTGDGLDPRQLPTDLEALSALWRTRMAGRRVLLVLDNAADSTQVTPLLPGGTGTLVLVTSRRHLGDLPYAVTGISLDVLPPPEAVAMFVRHAPRAAGHEEQVGEVVALAGHLPLAVVLLARVFTKHRAWSLNELIDQARTRLLTLSPEQRTVAAAFDLSYQGLPASRQRFFRLLGLHPGSDLDAYAAAALTGTSLAHATAHLEALYSDHLVTEPGYGRYGMHDLIRAHARTLAAASDPLEQREMATDRLLGYYAHTAQAASVLVTRYPRPDPDGPAPAHAPVFSDEKAARAWLRAEHPNLDAAFTHAHTHALDRHVIALAAGLAEILSTDGPWTRALQVHQSAADTAERSGHPAAHASALNDLGLVRYQVGDFPAAVDAHTRALEICRVLGNRFGEVTALNDLGIVRYMVGDFPGAVDAHTRALEIYRVLGHRNNEAWALNHYAAALAATGQRPHALALYHQALAMNRELSKPDDEAISLEGIADHHLATGDTTQGIEHLRQALEIYQHLGMRVDIERVTARLAELGTP